MIPAGAMLPPWKLLVLHQAEARRDGEERVLGCTRGPDDCLGLDGDGPDKSLNISSILKRTSAAPVSFRPPHSSGGNKSPSLP